MICPILLLLHFTLKDINTATLTGAVDVILVESPDGIFRSTPFHVRFGKIGVVWSHEKQLDVEINGQEVDLVMRLDQYGLGYFPDITSTVLYCSGPVLQ